MADKTDKQDIYEFDELDLQIIALRRDNPRITTRAIARAIGIGKTAVWKRLRRIGESDYVKLCRAEMADMLPLAQRAFILSLRNPDKRLEAAKALLNGLGIFTTKNELTGKDGGPIQISTPVFILPDNDSAPKEQGDDERS